MSHELRATNPGVHENNAAEQSWTSEHGACRRVARTIIDPSPDVFAIVSTVVLASGFGMTGGAFTVLETKVFGISDQDLKTRLRLKFMGPIAFREGMSQHARMVERVAELCLSRR